MLLDLRDCVSIDGTRWLHDGQVRCRAERAQRRQISPPPQPARRPAARGEKDTDEKMQLLPRISSLGRGQRPVGRRFFALAAAFVARVPPWRHLASLLRGALVRGHRAVPPQPRRAARSRPAPARVQRAVPPPPGPLDPGLARRARVALQPRPRVRRLPPHFCRPSSAATCAAWAITWSRSCRLARKDLPTRCARRSRSR
jgi:hypothetical protein